jgi:protein-S-isoprenylcysteine O-methyltransferase Ste14
MKSLLFFCFGILPHILTVGLAAYAMWDWRGSMFAVGATLIGLYLLWAAVESSIITVQDSKRGDSSQDRGTFEFYFYSKWATVYSALLIPPLHADLTLMIGGCGLFLGGVLFRLWSISVLGRMYSHQVRINEDHRIIQRGPYRVIRHPSYLGMLVAHIGFIITFFNWVPLFIFVLAFLPSVITRILVEERALMELPGYPEYSRTRKRLLPCIW